MKMLQVQIGIVFHSVFVELAKNLNVGTVMNVILVNFFKFCTVIASVGPYLFVSVLVILTLFQGHSGV